MREQTLKEMLRVFNRQPFFEQPVSVVVGDLDAINRMLRHATPPQLRAFVLRAWRQWARAERDEFFPVVSQRLCSRVGSVLAPETLAQGARIEVHCYPDGQRYHPPVFCFSGHPDRLVNFLEEVRPIGAAL